MGLQFTQPKEIPAQGCLACPDCKGVCFEVFTLASLPETILQKTPSLR